MLNIHDAIENKYRDLAASAGADGIKREEAVGLIADDLAGLAARGEIEAPVDYLALAARHLNTIDRHDREQQQDRLALARDALGDATILGDLDPILATVCVVGDGVRRTYRYVTSTDVLAMIRRKARHAEDAASAARRFTDVATDVLEAMRVRGVDTLGDLFP